MLSNAEPNLNESIYEEWASYHGVPLQDYIDEQEPDLDGDQVVTCLSCWRDEMLGERVCHVITDEGVNLSHTAKTIFHRCSQCGGSWYIVKGAKKGIHLGMV